MLSPDFLSVISKCAAMSSDKTAACPVTDPPSPRFPALAIASDYTIIGDPNNVVVGIAVLRCCGVYSPDESDESDHSERCSLRFPLIPFDSLDLLFSAKL